MTQGPSYSPDEIHFRLVTRSTFLPSNSAFWKGAFSQATLKISTPAPIEEGAGQIQVSILGVYIEEGGGSGGFCEKCQKRGTQDPFFGFFWVFSVFRVLGFFLGFQFWGYRGVLGSRKCAAARLERYNCSPERVTVCGMFFLYILLLLFFCYCLAALH